MKSASFRNQILYRILRSGLAAFLISVVLAVLVFYPLLKQEAVRDNKSTNNLILQRLEETLGFAEDYAQYLSSAIETSDEITEYFQNPSSQSEALARWSLNNLNNYNTMVRGVALISENAESIDSITNLTDEDYEFLESDFIIDMNKNTFSRIFSPVYKTTLGRETSDTTAYVRNFFLNNRWITVILFINLSDVEYEISSLAEERLEAYYLCDSSGRVFFRHGREKEIEKARDVISKLESGEYVEEEGSLIFIDRSVTTNYYVVSAVSMLWLMSELFPYLIGLFLAMLLFLLLALWITSKSVTEAVRPIQNLSVHMLKAAAGDLDSKVQSTRNDEIGQLESSYNKMIDDLRQSMEVIKEKEIFEQQQRFSLLISQIDPHFIYNTINSINYLARRKRFEDIVTVNTALLVILRDRLRVSDIQITDTVTNEIRVVNQYIEIEKFMYGGDLTVKWDIADQLMEEQIPKNMIQPLVENALFHGLIDEESGQLHGTVQITLNEAQKGILELVVADDGIGMDEECLEKVRSEKFDPSERGYRIGLSNIRGRLYYLYGNEDMLKIESRLGGGTRIIIQFQKNYKEKSEKLMD